MTRKLSLRRAGNSRAPAILAFVVASSVVWKGAAFAVDNNPVVPCVLDPSEQGAAACTSPTSANSFLKNICCPNGTITTCTGSPNYSPWSPADPHNQPLQLRGVACTPRPHVWGTETVVNNYLYCGISGQGLQFVDWYFWYTMDNDYPVSPGGTCSQDSYWYDWTGRKTDAHRYRPITYNVNGKECAVLTMHYRPCVRQGNSDTTRGGNPPPANPPTANPSTLTVMNSGCYPFNWTLNASGQCVPPTSVACPYAYLSLGRDSTSDLFNESQRGSQGYVCSYNPPDCGPNARLRVIGNLAWAAPGTSVPSGETRACIGNNVPDSQAAAVFERDRRLMKAIIDARGSNSQCAYAIPNDPANPTSVTCQPWTSYRPPTCSGNTYLTQVQFATFMCLDRSFVNDGSSFLDFNAYVAGQCNSGFSPGCGGSSSNSGTTTTTTNNSNNTTSTSTGTANAQATAAAAPTCQYDDSRRYYTCEQDDTITQNIPPIANGATGCQVRQHHFPDLHCTNPDTGETMHTVGPDSNGCSWRTNSYCVGHARSRYACRDNSCRPSSLDGFSPPSDLLPAGITPWAFNGAGEPAKDGCFWTEERACAVECGCEPHYHEQAMIP